MIEGWQGKDYLVIFSESEIGPASHQYSISNYLEGFQLVGLRSWDDFILKDAGGKTFLIPTVPLDPKYLEPCAFPSAQVELKPDARFAGKIKWYLTPLAFGGDPNQKENCAWVNHEQHAQLVRFWNEKYASIKSSDPRK